MDSENGSGSGNGNSEHSGSDSLRKSALSEGAEKADGREEAGPTEEPDTKTQEEATGTANRCDDACGIVLHSTFLQPCSM